MPKTIKIFGERNTSTNAMKALILNNSRSKIAPSVARDLDPNLKRKFKLAEKVGLPRSFREWIIDDVFRGRGPGETWKHTATNFKDVKVFSDYHLVFCVRHPASWILGLYKRPYHIYGQPVSSLAAFLDKRWKSARRERLNRQVVGAIQLYNIKMLAFQNFQRELSAAGITFNVVRHEDFAVDQEAVFATLSEHLENPNSEFEPLDASTKDSHKSRDYYREYYGGQLWRKEIDADSVDRINDGIDWSVLKALDYKPLS